MKTKIGGDSTTLAGVQNLLHNCVDIKPGQRVLFIGESSDSDFFDPNVCEQSAQHARKLGAMVDVVRAAPVSGPEMFPTDIAKAIESSDHTIFFSRLGDQMRFCPLPGEGSKTMCYTANERYLNDDFSTVPYGLFKEIHDRLVDVISSARRYQISCPNGTRLEAELPNSIGESLWASRNSNTRVNKFTVENFPVLIFPPLACTELNGNLNLSNWLTSTSTHQDDDSVLFVPSPVIANIENSKIANLQGDEDTVHAVKRFYKQKSGQFGGDTWVLNSWHAGIYPKSFYDQAASINPERWGSLCFGSPRFAHFHTCGDDPGQIAINVIDPTISFDDQVLWEQGHFRFLEMDSTQELLAKYGVAADTFSTRRDIGLDA